MSALPLKSSTSVSGDSAAGPIGDETAPKKTHRRTFSKRRVSWGGLTWGRRVEGFGYVFCPSSDQPGALDGATAQGRLVGRHDRHPELGPALRLIGLSLHITLMLALCAPRSTWWAGSCDAMPPCSSCLAR